MNEVKWLPSISYSYMHISVSIVCAVVYQSGVSHRMYVLA